MKTDKAKMKLDKNESDPASFFEGVMKSDEFPFPPEEDMVRVPIVDCHITVPMPFVPVNVPLEFRYCEKIVSEAISTGKPVVYLYHDDIKDIYSSKSNSRVGILSHIIKMSHESESEDPMVMSIGGPRVKVERFNSGKNGRSATLKYYNLVMDCNAATASVYLKSIAEQFDKINKLNDVPAPLATELLEIPNPETILWTIVFQMPALGVIKNQILNCESFTQASELLLEHLNTIGELVKIRKDINDRTRKELEAQQREIFIQKQIAMLQDELSQGEDNDYEALYHRSQEKKWNEDTARHFKRELEKLNRYNPTSPDYSVQYSYLDTFLSLPWQKYSESDFDFNKIEEILDRDHFGLERVKERILEQMAVTKLRTDNKAPIICLVGPPGVGKTSLGKSIAEAMGRAYQRVSFGGLHDEAEIRGHRRTYLGAMPGRIITALMRCEYSNPVLVLDEIDKIGNDYKGDPSTALLEVLDPEQNSHFHDNYLDADYDLSNVLFIATANSLQTISQPLLDRMEIISIPGYITAEKIEIASRHLVRKQLLASGFKEDEICFENEALEYLIDYYTRESGVRRLEKSIGKVLRKLALRRVRGQEVPTVITKDIVSDLLGKEEYSPELYENNQYPGVVTGLAWTSVGGEILFIESSVTEGKGNLSLTGNLGNVMKESAELASKYLKSHSELIGMQPSDFEKKDIHIHVPEGAIPKDGPSAGITIATSLASSFTGRKVKSNLAMTGEITLRGKVLPVGGIKEKIIAAKRAGIKEIILSKENRKDVDDIKAAYVDGLDFRYVDNVEDVIRYALI